MSKNLLRDDLTQGQIKAILDAHPRSSSLPALDSAPWKKAIANPLLQSLAREIRARAGKEIGQHMPPLTDELYAIYSKTGSRWEFETVYFERRRQLARAALSLLLSAPSDAARALLTQSLLAKLTETLDEPSWAFPAHVNMSWKYPDRPDPVAGIDPLQIDLFAAETANLMAELLDYFGTLIPAELRQRMLARLNEQFWKNYIGKVKYPEFHWATIGNNWNAVCHQGVLGSALAALDDTDLLADMLYRAKTGLPHFLSGFGEDGGSSEGPGYWDYGFGWFAILNEQLEARTGGELSLFSDDPHVVEIARFGPRGSLSGGHLIGFSDSPSIGVLRPQNLSYLGERLNDPLCRDQALVNYAQVLKKGVDLDFQRSDTLYLARFFLRCPDKLPEKSSNLAVKDVYMKNLAVVVAASTDSRDHLWEFAVKAGHNDEHHNHNDCGNYTLNIDGIRFVTEIGQPLYTREFFGPQRYENLAARSLSHSVPLINGCEQAAGREYASVVVDYFNSPQETRFVIDLTACYPAAAACKKLIRTFQIDKTAGKLTVRDEFELTEVRSVETAIATIHPVKIGSDSATISCGSLSLVLQLESGTVPEEVEEHQYRHHDPVITEPVAIQRIVLKPSTLAPKFTLGFVAQLG